MGRRWLLGILGGVAMTLGVSAAPALAQEVPGVTAPATVEAGDLATVTVEADPATTTLEATAATDLAGPEETALAPAVDVTLSPAGPAVELDDTSELAGEPVPVTETLAPVTELLEPVADATGEAAPVPAGPAPVAPSSKAAGGEVRPAPAPAQPSSAALPRSARASLSGADTGVRVVPEVPVAGELAPLVAPPAPADEPLAVAPMAVPALDTTPTVPAGLRLLAGLMVIGSALVWRRVRGELA